MKELDLLVIGSGQGSVVLADGLTAKGWNVAVAERRHAGGSCVNFGCTPTKAVLASAKVAHNARRGSSFGIRIPTIEPQFGEVMRLARELVTHSRESTEKELGDRLMRGHARFAGHEGERYRLTVGDEQVLAKYVVLNTGTRTLMPKIEGLDAVDCLDAGNWIDQTDLPRRIAIVGGGYIASEMGQFYCRMGSEVTVIDRGAQPLAREDEDVSAAIRACLERDGVGFLMNTSFDRVVRDGQAWRLTCTCPDGPRDVIADAVFVATGRKANLDDLGLDLVGVEVDDKGTVKVDEHLRTSAQNVFAIGDIRGGPMFTSTAWDDGRIVRDLLLGDGRRTTDRVVPYAVYTHPEVARVGLSEREAEEQGKRFRVGRFELKSNAHAQEERETDGFVKLLIEEGTDKLLGAAIVAEEAAEMIHVLAALMVAHGTCATLRDMLMVHPTFAEAVQSAVL